MKAFRFRFDSLLQLRKTQERIGRLQAAQAYAQLQTTLDKLARLQDDIQDLHQQLTSENTGKNTQASLALLDSAQITRRNLLERQRFEEKAVVAWTNRLRNLKIAVNVFESLESEAKRQHKAEQNQE